jgi:hypothetical protein
MSNFIGPRLLLGHEVVLQIRPLFEVLGSELSLHPLTHPVHQRPPTRQNPLSDRETGFARSSTHFSPLSGLNVAGNDYIWAVKMISYLLVMMQNFVKQETAKVNGNKDTTPPKPADVSNDTQMRWWIWEGIKGLTFLGKYR